MPPKFGPPSFIRSSASSTDKPTEVKLPSNPTEVTNSSASKEFNDPNDNVQLWEEGWHERYYRNKFKVDKDLLNKRRQEVVEDYTRGLCWVLQYYYHDVPSWDW